MRRAMWGLWYSAKERSQDRLIYHFQNTSVVGQKIKELKDRVYHLSVVIVETFTPNNEIGSDEVIVKVAKGIERDIKDLLR